MAWCSPTTRWVAGAASITVTDIGNGYWAAVVGYNRTGDIAVLQLSGASGLATARLPGRLATRWPSATPAALPVRSAA
jgi:hypothetical protein